MKNLFYLLSILFFISCSEEASIAPNEQSTNGINGSYSQIIVYGDYLYGLNDQLLSTVDISDKEDVQVIHQQELDFDIESIYRYEDLLFIGSSSQMYIFTIGSNGIPVLNSTTNYIFERITCNLFDPVITDGKYAYVTLHVEREDNCFFIGRPVNATVNELQIYDISDIENPKFINKFNLRQPKGLVKKDHYLFICDTWNVKILDVSDVENIKLFHTLPNTESYDAIIKEDILLVVGGNEYVQFDIKDMNNIRELSRISF